MTISNNYVQDNKLQLTHEICISWADTIKPIIKNGKIQEDCNRMMSDIHNLYYCKLYFSTGTQLILEGQAARH